MTDADWIVKYSTEACRTFGRLGEELTGDVIERAFVSYTKYFDGDIGSKHFFNWIYTIAKNTYLNELKRIKMKGVVEAEWSKDVYSGWDDDIRRKKRLDRFETEVRCIIDSYTPNERKIILGRLDGLTLKSVSLVNNIPFESVRSSYRRAKNKLKRDLVTKKPSDG